MKATTLALTAALEPSTPRRDPIPFDSRLIEQAIREGVAGVNPQQIKRLSWREGVFGVRDEKTMATGVDVSPGKRGYPGLWGSCGGHGSGKGLWRAGILHGSLQLTADSSAFDCALY